MSSVSDHVKTIKVQSKAYQIARLLAAGLTLIPLVAGTKQANGKWDRVKITPDYKLSPNATRLSYGKRAVAVPRDVARLLGESNRVCIDTDPPYRSESEE